MTVYTIMQEYRNHHPHGHYFDTETLRFFGERISEMRVLKKTKIVNGRVCYVLSTLQRNAPGGPIRHYAYVDAETFDIESAG